MTCTESNRHTPFRRISTYAVMRRLLLIKYRHSKKQLAHEKNWDISLNFWNSIPTQQKYFCRLRFFVSSIQWELPPHECWIHRPLANICDNASMFVPSQPDVCPFLSVYLCVTRLDQLTTRNAKLSPRPQCEYEDLQRTCYTCCKHGIYTMVNDCVITHRGRSVVYHGEPWYTLVYHGVPYTMVKHGNPWYTMVYTMVYYGATVS